MKRWSLGLLVVLFSATLATAQQLVYEWVQHIGYSDLTQGTVGAQVGGQSFSELLVFEYKIALDRFKAGQFGFAAGGKELATDLRYPSALDGSAAMHLWLHKAVMPKLADSGEKGRKHCCPKNQALPTGRGVVRGRLGYSSCEAV